MSSAFGIDQNDTVNLYSINLATGVWSSHVAFNPALGVGQQPVSLAYDCLNSQMYLLTVDGFMEGRLYTLNTSTGNNAQVGGISNIDNPRGLVYDVSTDTTYGIAALEDSNTKTYTVDLTTNMWTALSDDSGSHFNLDLAYNCSTNVLYGLGANSALSEFQIYIVDRNDGSWDALPSTVNAAGVFLSLLWNDPNNFYACAIAANMWEINPVTGGVDVQLPNPTGVQIPVSMALERPCCCVHEDTLVSLASKERVRISSIKAGDLVLDHKSQPVRVISNVCSGRCNEFISLPANIIGSETDLLIRDGHPVLINGQEIECQDIYEGKTVTLPGKARVFTLLTESKTFVRMNGGALVATWSEEAFKNYLQNDLVGQHLTCQKQ